VKKFAFIFLVCCGKTNPVTPPGTVVVEWDHTKATRADFAKAKVGPHAAKDFKATVSHPDTPPYTVTVHVEEADVDYVEGGQPVHQHAPVVMKITVTDNGGWELSGNCMDGPNYEMPSVGPDGGLVTPMGMQQDCLVKEHRTTRMGSSWDVGTHFIAKGGKVGAFPGDDVKVE